MLFIIAVLFALSLNHADACTTFVVGKSATVDGSVMATHSNDGDGTTDPRLVKIPRAKIDSGSLRPVWSSPEWYPRYVGTERNAPAYYTENCQSTAEDCVDFQPIGFIPQPNESHTFGYFEQTYGALNEKQVGICESTCSGVFVGRAVDAGGTALLSVDQLSQIAMERGDTAKKAVQLMGDLAVKFGFYGESDSFEGGSESLIVTDPNEAWVFHILAGPTGTSAIWAAARVPDDSVAVVANMFSIRVMDLADTDNFLGSAGMWDIAKEHGLWNEDMPKDFTATFSDGEYSHKYYSGRRMWAVFRHLAPSLNLPAEYGNLKTDAPYPFAARVEKKVGPRDMMNVMRDWYNGTVYSTSQRATNGSLASGAYETPDRWSGGEGESQVEGNWERTIGIYRSSDSQVVQSRSWLPDEVGGVLWYAPGAAHFSTYLPVMAGMQVAPRVLGGCWQGTYDLSCLYWSVRQVLNLAQARFSYMIVDIRRTQDLLEQKAEALVAELSAAYLATVSSSSSSSPSLSSRTAWAPLEQALARNADEAQTAYTDLFKLLMFKYADGWLNLWDESGFHSYSVGYPAWWLQKVGYKYGPPPVDSSPASVSQAASMTQATAKKAHSRLRSEGGLKVLAAMSAVPGSAAGVENSLGLQGLDRLRLRERRQTRQTFMSAGSSEAMTSCTVSGSASRSLQQCILTVCAVSDRGDEVGLSKDAEESEEREFEACTKKCMQLCR